MSRSGRYREDGKEPDDREKDDRDGEDDPFEAVHAGDRRRVVTKKVPTEGEGERHVKPIRRDDEILAESRGGDSILGLDADVAGEEDRCETFRPY